MIYTWDLDKAGKLSGGNSFSFPTTKDGSKILLKIEDFHPGDFEAIQGKVIEKNNESHAFPIECRLKNPLGDWIWTYGICVPSLGVKGEDNYLCSTREIDLKNDLAESLRVKLTKAELALHVKSGFLANMSHEIRSPVQAILGYSHILADNSLSVNEREKMTHSMEKCGHYLLELVKDILDFSKIEAGKEVVENVPCSPWLVLNEVIETVGLKAVEKGLLVQVQAREPIPALIHTDPLKLRQILVNLASNAIKFTSKGKITIDLFLQCCEGGKTKLAFLVIDQGPGMTKEQIQGLFQPFVRVNRGRLANPEGTGLGLTITQKLAQLLGGTIQVSSAEGKGSSFTFLLPVAESQLQKRIDPGQLKALITPSKHQITSTLSLGELARILLAEDSEDIQVYFKYLLEKEGLEVCVVGSGLEVLQLVKQQAFDLILLDIQMPNLNGLETARMLRGLGIKTHLIAVTAMATKEDEANCFAAGFDYYLTKPVDRETLLEALAYFLPKTKDEPFQENKNTVPQRDWNKIFFANLVERKKPALEAIASHDKEALSRLLHQMKGSASVFGFTSLAEKARNIEIEVLQGAIWANLENSIKEFFLEAERLNQES